MKVSPSFTAAIATATLLAASPFAQAATYQQSILLAPINESTVSDYEVVTGFDGPAFNSSGKIDTDLQIEIEKAPPRRCFFDVFGVEVCRNDTFYPSRTVDRGRGRTMLYNSEIAYIDAFDTSLGVLNEVRIETAVVGSPFLRVTELGDSCSEISFFSLSSRTCEESFDTTGGGSARIQPRLVGDHFWTQGPPVTRRTDEQGGNNTSLAGMVSEGAISAEIYNDLLAQTGSGFFEFYTELRVSTSGTLECTFSANFSGECEGGLRTRFSSSATAQDTIDPQFRMAVTYDFTPHPVDPPAVVPIPAGFPLLLAGLGALAMVRRHSKSDIH